MCSPKTTGTQSAHRPPGFTIAEPASRWPWWRALPSTIGGLILKLYRLIISPLYGPVCRYYPSCSAYGLEAVTTHGLFKGSWLTAKRLGRCHPFTDGGVDHVPPGRRYFEPGAEPRIIVLNHPPIPADEETE